MKLLVLSGPEVHGLLPPGACADAMRGALAARARGEVYQPLRTVIRPDGAAGLMALMPCYLPGGERAPGAPTGPGPGGYGLKAICIVPGNGTGVQARSHLMAITAARPLTQIRVAGRDQGRARRFAELMRARTAVPLVACGSAAEAVEGAGIVVTATTSPEPVLRREWLAPGAHVNAVGACVPQARELDTATMSAAALFADSRESVLAESGDFLLAQADGAIGPEHIRAEIGEVLGGAAPGRRAEDEITVFESLGLAVEDLAAAALAYRKAEELGAGTWVEF